MNSQGIQRLLEQGEGIEVEFKLAVSTLGSNAFETICAFLNRRGGHLLLGVSDTGGVEGVQPGAVKSMVGNIVNSCNNPQKLTPPFYLSPEVIDVNGRKIVYIFVPESSQVHSTAGKIFDRNSDGDYNITASPQLVADLYIRKQQTYTENRIYPALQLSDLREDLFIRARKLARSQRPDHPWLELSDMEMLRSAGLHRKDYITGSEGFTLAAVLLLGSNEVIQQVLPHYRTDAIYRVSDTDRYDDRDDIRTNLIDAYDRLMAFVAKHLPDKFFQDGSQRISVRDRLFREVIGNLLVHREFSNPFPAKLIIEREQLVAENWNKPHGDGLIDPALFAPFPKNPAIARFFKEIGRVDELGSGIRNIFKYGKLYAPGRIPQLIEEDIFQAVVPIESSILTVSFHDTVNINDAGTGNVDRDVPDVDTVSVENVGVNKETAGVNKENTGVNKETAGVNKENTGVNKGTAEVNKENTGVNKETAEVNIDADGLKRRMAKIVAEAISGVKIGVYGQMEQVVYILWYEPGLKTNVVAQRMAISARSLERYLKQLKLAGLIEFRGAPKTGGYYLTMHTIDKIKTDRSS